LGIVFGKLKTKESAAIVWGAAKPDIGHPIPIYRWLGILWGALARSLPRKINLLSY
jgi:hypothetical protein